MYMRVNLLPQLRYTFPLLLTKRFLMLLGNPSPFYPRQGKPLICCLTLYVSINFLKFYMNEIRYFVFYLVWLFFMQYTDFETLSYCYMYQQFDRFSCSTVFSSVDIYVVYPINFLKFR